MDEVEFQRGIRGTDWWRQYVARYGEAPDLETPDYDYRRAWAAGARPAPYEGDIPHWPSQFKGAGHPSRFVSGIDTSGVDPMGQPAATFDERFVGAPFGSLSPAHDAAAQRVRSSVLSPRTPGGITMGLQALGLSPEILARIVGSTVGGAYGKMGRQ